MALEVEDGTGKADAESYLSVADADLYHTAHGAPALWTDSTTELKEDALRLATQFLDVTYGPRWDGTRINATMALDWPRYGVADRDGFLVESTAVPVQVEHATAYLALKVREGTTLIPDVAVASNLLAKSVTMGPMTISKTFAGGSASTSVYFSIVSGMLGDLILSAGRVYRA